MSKTKWLKTMRTPIIGVVVALMALLLCTGALADTVTIQDTTPLGDGTNVRDTCLRSDGMANWNGGNSYGSGAARFLPDVGYPDGKGPRHELMGFDLSGIAAGSTINSATMGIYLTRSGSVGAITDFKISRLQPLTTWVEGTGLQPAATGEPTWDERLAGPPPNLPPSGTPWGGWGATGAADIDLGTSITWGMAAGASSGWQTFDVTGFVNGWVNGGWENNGVLFWGGIGPGGTTYYYLMTSEDPSVTLRPYLMVDYTPIPEPGSFLALGSGLIAMAGFALRRKRA